VKLDNNVPTSMVRGKLGLVKTSPHCGVAAGTCSPFFSLDEVQGGGGGDGGRGEGSALNGSLSLPHARRTHTHSHSAGAVSQWRTDLRVDVLPHPYSPHNAGSLVERQLCKHAVCLHQLASMCVCWSFVSLGW
jgi:hypothetical protein